MNSEKMYSYQVWCSLFWKDTKLLKTMFFWINSSELQRGWLRSPAKSLQSCPTLCHPTDGSPPGSSDPGILQARTLEWVAVSFSNEWKWKVKVKSPSRVLLSATPWTAAHQAPLSMGFSRQECWSGVPLPSPTKVLSSAQIKLSSSLTTVWLLIISFDTIIIMS